MPTAFRSVVERHLGAGVELMDLPDHHAYGAADLARIGARAGGRPVVMTAKDAVKLAPFALELPNAYVLHDVLRWEWGEPEIVGLLDALVSEAVAG